MDKLSEIIKRCKCGVYLTVNEHRDVYQSVEDFIKEQNNRRENTIDEDLAKRLIEADAVYALQFYPDTPVGFYLIYGPSLDEVLDQALEVFEEI